MTLSKPVTIDNLAKIRDFYLSTEFFRDKYKNVVAPLIQAFNPEKGMPLDMESPTDYFTSTTSTALLSLFHTGIRDASLLNEFHEVIFKMRDHSENSVIKKKAKEDVYAWDVSESASVWATSLATWSLLETQYQGNRKDEVKSALLWLANQRQANGGWGFDINCKSRPFFTGLALHALRLGLSCCSLNKQEKHQIANAINNGIQFILSEQKEENKTVYWATAEGNTDPDATSTLYALWALFEHDADKYQDLIEGGLRYIRKDLQGKDIWEFREIVSEIDTKYKTQKIVVTFTPAFPLLLLKLGVSPLDDMCVKPIVWLADNRETKGWGLPNYSQNSLSFTTAFALWTINQWHKYLLEEFLKKHARHPMVLQALRRRISILLGFTIGSVLLLVFFLTPIPQGVLTHIEAFVRGLSVISSLLAILGISGLIPALIYLDSHFLGKRISGFIKRSVKKAKNIIYAQ